MSHEDRIADFVRREQREIFRLACRDLQLHLKQIAADSGLPYSNVKVYAAGDAQMPISAIKRLLSVDGFAPYLSRLFAPEGFALVAADTDADHDGLAADAIDYAGEHARARHPASPGGVEIVESERECLAAKAVRLRRVA